MTPTEMPVTTQETPEVQESQEVQETQDEFSTITMEGQEFTLRGHTPAKGKAKGRLQLLLEPEKDETGALDYDELFAKLKAVVGEENWNKTIYAEVVRQACLDATQEAIKASTDGIPHDDDYEASFKAYYLPTTRRTGEHIKDLRARVGVIMAEVAPMLLRLNTPADAPNANPLSEEEMLRCTVLMEEFTALTVKIEGKSRKGEKKSKK